MAEILNLRLARKTRARAKAQENAAQNRAKHGRTKGEKRSDEAEAAKIVRLLDGAKLED